MNSPTKPDDGVSSKIKIFVILLTIITVVAFIAFFFKLISKFSSPTKISTPDNPVSRAQELRIVGDKLKKAGLKKLAIEEYIKFLQRAEADSKTRAEVSQTLGEIYAELEDCRQGLVWFYRAQVAGPDSSSKDALESQIDACLKEINSGRP